MEFIKFKLQPAFAFFISVFSAFAQIYDPVSWTTEVEKNGENQYSLIAKAEIDSNWHMYSMKQYKGEITPIPTSFTFEKSTSYKLVGTTQQGIAKKIFDKIFNMNIEYFEKQASFTQKVKLLKDDPTNIRAQVEYMVCDDKQCLPPELKELNFNISPNKISEKKITPTIEKYNEESPFSKTQENKISNQPDTISQDKNTKDITNQQEQKTLLGVFIISFLAGLAALLTPCVFPMIPMTISFFTKQSKNKTDGVLKALIYGLSIIILYVGIGFFVTKIFGADALNALSTNPYFNILFFVILVLFAASFFGAFEIMLPQSWSNAVDSKTNRKDFIGIFFMALALSIVSFSCTGPIVGTLLVETASKGGLAPIIGMLGFSFALALPFTFFAISPGMLKSLPKSGGWLNSVKVVLGFLELALAFKFLSNADMVWQLHILEREIFISIWIAIFASLTLYLFGKLKLPHDSPLKYISVTRLFLGLLTLTFTLYMIPGLWGAPLKIISAFPPPIHYSESPLGINNNSSGLVLEELPEDSKYGPHQIVTFTDYDKGLDYARRVNKPILLDFTGHACVNCRNMEANVWSEPEVLQLIRDYYVLISLYVDENIDLPKQEQYVSETTGKKIKRVGQKWSDFQIKHYNINAQPYYVLLDLEGRKLTEPRGFNLNVEAYKDWLKKGIDKFRD